MWTTAAFADEPRIITSKEELAGIQWTDEERLEDVARRMILKRPGSSHHLILLNKAETLHTHDRHDLTVFILKGSARLHLGGKEAVLNAGDVVDIPRGMPHGAQNLGAEPAEAYGIFTPAFDGKDTHEITPHDA